MIQMGIIVSLLIVIKIVERHAPLKKRFVRGNQSPFMNKELREAIYTRIRLRNNFWKTPHTLPLPLPSPLPLKRMKRSTKYKEINVCLLERKILRKIILLWEVFSWIYLKPSIAFPMIY